MTTLPNVNPFLNLCVKEMRTQFFSMDPPLYDRKLSLEILCMVLLLYSLALKSKMEFDRSDDDGPATVFFRTEGVSKYFHKVGRPRTPAQLVDLNHLMKKLDWEVDYRLVIFRTNPSAQNHLILAEMDLFYSCWINDIHNRFKKLLYKIENLRKDWGDVTPHPVFQDLHSWGDGLVNSALRGFLFERYTNQQKMACEQLFFSDA